MPSIVEKWGSLPIVTPCGVNAKVAKKIVAEYRLAHESDILPEPDGTLICFADPVKVIGRLEEFLSKLVVEHGMFELLEVHHDERIVRCVSAVRPPSDATWSTMWDTFVADTACLKSCGMKGCAAIVGSVSSDRLREALNEFARVYAIDRGCSLCGMMLTYDYLHERETQTNLVLLSGDGSVQGYYDKIRAARRRLIDQAAGVDA